MPVVFFTNVHRHCNTGSSRQVRPPVIPDLVSSFKTNDFFFDGLSYRLQARSRRPAFHQYH